MANRIQTRIQNAMRVIHPMRLIQFISRRIQVYQGGVEVLSRR